MSDGSRKDGSFTSRTPGILGKTLGTTPLNALIQTQTPLVKIQTTSRSAPSIWETAVSEYRRSPSDATFNVMGMLCPSGDKSPIFSQVVFPIAIQHHTAMFMRHLAISFLVDRRLLEANHFADRWLSLEPDSFDALRLKTTVCIERGDLQSAADYYNKMGPMRPTSIEVVRLRLMLCLRADQISNAREYAQPFLEFQNLFPSDLLLVAETAVRARDPDLARAVALQRGRATYNLRGELMLREVVRLGLLRTMAARANDL